MVGLRSRHSKKHQHTCENKNRDLILFFISASNFEVSQWPALLITVIVMVMLLLVAFVQIPATAAHGTANESPCAASDEAANQRTTARSTNDGGVTFPPMLILIPGYGFVGKRPCRLGGRKLRRRSSGGIFRPRTYSASGKQARVRSACPTRGNYPAS